MDNHQEHITEAVEQAAVAVTEPQNIQEMKAAVQEKMQAEVVPVVAEAVVENGAGHNEVFPATEVAPLPAPAQPVAVPSTDGSSIITPLMKKQLDHCAAVLKGLKRHAQSGPFQAPVDPVALGIPDYPTVIKNPMDLSTIQGKMDMAIYTSPDAFQADVKLMFANCYTYNKPDTQVYAMAKSLERYFDNYYGKMPTDLSTPSTDDFGGKRRKSETVSAARPRRESAAVSATRAAVIPAAPMGRGKRSSPEITFCMNTWKELTKKSYANIAWPFMEPVDPVKLGIPDYFNVIKTPMDLSTVKKKLDAGSYSTADDFEADIRLVFQNCYLYNGAESDVSRLGRDLEAVFDRKWATKPLPGAAGTPNGYDDFDADAEKILQLNKQIQALQKELDELLTKRQHKRAAPSKPVAAAPKPKAARMASEAPATMTFEEKRQLSMDVNNLSPEKLGKVVEIIHNSMPNLQQQSDSDVIELDIESLDINTLRQLQKYVNECKGVKKQATRKPSTTGARPKKASNAGAEPLHAPILEESISSDDSSSSDDE
jgi:bromodomain-containing factor 1